jgi:hypothetical protein
MAQSGGARLYSSRKTTPPMAGGEVALGRWNPGRAGEQKRRQTVSGWMTGIGGIRLYVGEGAPGTGVRQG